MKMIAVEQAVGKVLVHDITQIIPGRFKGRAFKKGHVIQSEDVPKLLTMGKEHIYIFDPEEGLVHEDTAALRIAQAVAGEGLRLTVPCEGRVNLHATVPGLLKVHVPGLTAVNAVPDVVLATLHTNQQVKAGRAVAGTRIIPLVVPEERLRQVEAICRESRPLVDIKPFRAMRVGIVTTGSEVYHGRIKDEFGPVLRNKFGLLGCTVLRQELVSDDVAMTRDAILELIADGAELVAVTGGMSVDPDDRTPTSIRAAGGEVVTYGAPTFPGAMFMLARIGDVAVVGLPGCVMYARVSIFDLVVPRIVAGEEVSRDDILALGHGGYCESCETCHFPVCGFGKGA